MNDRSATTFRTYAANAFDYLNRHRDRSRMAPILRNFASKLPPGSVLDLGCGPGFDGDQLRKWGHLVVGLDRTKHALRLAGENYPGPYACADIRALPIRGSLAGVWASASLLHLEPAELAHALRSVRQRLVPHGVLWLSMKEGHGSGWDFTYGKQHPRWFTYWSPQELDRALTDAGFEISESNSSAGARNTWLHRLAVVGSQAG